MRPEPDGPGLREPTIRIVIERQIAVEFFPHDDTEPFVKVDPEVLGLVDAPRAKVSAVR